MRRFALLLLVSSACAHPKPPAAPPDLHSARLAAAAAEVRAGCLDCLTSAFREYEALKSIPAAAKEATAGAVRTASLIALRERELGMVDEGYLQRGRDAASTAGAASAVSPELATLLDIIDATPSASVGAGRPTNDVDLDRMRVMRTNQAAWSDLLRRTASTEIAAAYTWLAFACGSGELRSLSRDEVLAPTTAFADAPLLQYRTATCRAVESATLDKLIASEPRFREIDFTRGQQLVARRKLDDADAAFERAHQWHPAWPTLTLSTANVAMTAEEFERALAMYDETLRYEPQAVDALLGKVRVLTFLARHQQAIDTVDVLLAERWYVGDGRYWRALNEMELERNDEAWTDVELAAKLLVNADVPKLAGLIAYRRQQLELSRTRFDLARTRNPNDCESAYYLGIVLGDLRDWTRVAAVMPEAARCLHSAEEHAVEEIETIRVSDAPQARKARQIAKREQSIATGRRWMVTSWFNTAVASYNLSRAADARAYAEKVVDDQQFGERARELLSRLR